MESFARRGSGGQFFLPESRGTISVVIYRFKDCSFGSCVLSVILGIFELLCSFFLSFFVDVAREAAASMCL